MLQHANSQINIFEAQVDQARGRIKRTRRRGNGAAKRERGIGGAGRGTLESECSALHCIVVELTSCQKF